MNHSGDASHANLPLYLPSSLNFDEENILRHVSGYILLSCSGNFKNWCQIKQLICWMSEPYGCTRKMTFQPMLMDTTGQPWMVTYLWSMIIRLPFLGRLKLKFVILYQPFWDPVLHQNHSRKVCWSSFQATIFYSNDATRGHACDQSSAKSLAGLWTLASFLCCHSTMETLNLTV